MAIEYEKKRRVNFMELRKYERPVQVSPIVEKIVKTATPDPKLSRFLYSSARKVALGELAKIKAGAPERVARAQIRIAGLKANLQFTKEETEAIIREFRPVTEIGKLPESIEKKLQTEREAKAKSTSLKKFAPLSSQLKKLTLSGWRLANLETHLAKTDEIQPKDLHHSFRLTAEGIQPLDIETTVSDLEEKGLPQESPVLEKYHQVQNQLESFREYFPGITEKLDNFHQATRQTGFSPEKIKTLCEKFKLPHLKIVEKLPQLEKLGKFSRFVKKLDLGAGKLTSRLAQTTIGKAVIAGAKKIGAAAVKVAAKAAVKLAAKAGIKLSLSAIGAALPTGVTQIIAIIGVISTALDALETIPGLGPIVKKLRQASPLSLLWKGITFPFRLFKQGQQENDPLKQAAGLGMFFLPFLATGLAILGPIAPIVLIGGVILIAGGAFLVSRLGVLVPKTIAGVSSVVSGAIAGTIGFLIALPSITVGVIPASLIIGAVATLAFLTIFIVVLIAGGAFLVTPYRAPIISPGGSKYIEVAKTANGTEHLEINNPEDLDNPPEIEYTITITATGSELTNVHVVNETRIRKPNPPDQTIVYTISNDQDGNGITSWQYDSITASETIEYTLRLHPDHIPGVTALEQIHDSWLIDMVTVTADVPAENLTGEISMATARVEIGDPPSLGPEGWPTTGGITQMPRELPSHTGSVANSIDITNSQGTPIYATHEGIAHCLTDGGYGTHVRLCSPEGCWPGGWETRYGHLLPGSCDHVDGQHVPPCQLIGLMSNTGFVIPGPGGDGTHLHYELRGNPGLGLDILDYVPNGHSVGRGSYVVDSCSGGPQPPIPTPTIHYLPTPVPTNTPSTPFPTTPPGHYSCRIIYSTCRLWENQCGPNEGLPPNHCGQSDSCVDEPFTNHECVSVP